MHLGETIKYTRKEIGITQAELAVRSDINRTYLSQIENNHKKPDISTLKNLSSNLKIPLSILVFLSLKISDIPPSKKTEFKLINKPLRSIIFELLKKE